MKRIVGMVYVDELDKKLIGELQRKANTPLYEIAKKFKGAPI